MSASTEKKIRQAAREAGTDRKTLAAQEEAKKRAQSKRRWTLGTILVVLLIVSILFLNSGLLYTQTTALQINGHKYSPAEFSYRYATEYQNFVSQYGSYASLFGLDTSNGLAGLKGQACPMLDDGDWRQYFMNTATDSLTRIQALCDYAAENGISLSEEEIAEVDSGFDSLSSYAETLGYGSVDHLLAANYGNGVTQKIARQAGLNESLADKVYNEKKDSFEYSPEELEEYYQGLEGASDIFSFAYYYVIADKVESEDEDGETAEEPTEQTLAEARATADAIVAAYQDGDEEDYSERFRVAVASQTDGDAPVERDYATGASLTSGYKSWLMDSRKAGDITVRDDEVGDGYYVVLFLSRDDNHYPLAQVRHILVKAEASEDGSYTDEAKAAAKGKAEDILALWKAGEHTEESFAEMAMLNSEDTGSNTNGGLYDAVHKGQMVEEFNDFCFEGHQPGDTAIVYGETSSYAGYHVVYYVGEGEQYSDTLARNALNSSAISDWLSALLENYTVTTGFASRWVG